MRGKEGKPVGLFSKIRDGLKRTRESMGASVSAMLSSFTQIDESLFEELEELLILGDVGVATAGRICDELRRKVREQGVKDPNAVYDLLRSIVADLLRGGEELKIETKPSVILVIGVNGVGKTTTIGKLAALLEKQGKKVILGAADTFRAAAIEQLEVWARRSGAELVKQTQGSDPASVVFDSVAAAKARGADVVICDTAGRLHNKKNLMEELAKINRVIQREAPDADREVLLVLDAATGQNAVNQAREFQAAADITGIVLTKLDGTPKGGVILSIREELNLPVKFIGVGEQVDDLQAFDADQFARALFERKEESDEIDRGDA
ncbi:signal recognition particle-docking protein FtsY [Caproiciproducens sp. NJN-50]|nr:signal recognition particle-docking protein FtsY [Caproiciproducens sp. NJN-50]